MARKPLVDVTDLKHEIQIDDRFWLVRWYRWLYGYGSTLTFCRLFWGTLVSLVPALFLGLAMPLWWPALQTTRHFKNKKQAKRTARKEREHRNLLAWREREEREYQERSELRQKADNERRVRQDKIQAEQTAYQEKLFQMRYETSLKYQMRLHGNIATAIANQHRAQCRLDAYVLAENQRQVDKQAMYLAHSEALEMEADRVFYIEQEIENAKCEKQEIKFQHTQLQKRLRVARWVEWREKPLSYRIFNSSKRRNFVLSHTVEDPGTFLVIPSIFNGQRQAVQKGAERFIDGMAVLYTRFTFALNHLSFVKTAAVFVFAMISLVFASAFAAVKWVSGKTLHIVANVAAWCLDWTVEGFFVLGSALIKGKRKLDHALKWDDSQVVEHRRNKRVKPVLRVAGKTAAAITPIGAVVWLVNILAASSFSLLQIGLAVGSPLTLISLFTLTIRFPAVTNQMINLIVWLCIKAWDGMRVIHKAVSVVANLIIDIVLFAAIPFAWIAKAGWKALTVIALPLTLMFQALRWIIMLSLRLLRLIARSSATGSLGLFKQSYRAVKTNTCPRIVVRENDHQS